jgi:hypothetical protein
MTPFGQFWVIIGDIRLCGQVGLLPHTALLFFTFSDWLWFFQG